jgi:hypothetical protein
VVPEELPEPLVETPELLEVVPEELPELVVDPELLDEPPELLDATPTPELLPEELPELLVEIPELLEVPLELLEVLPELLVDTPELLPEELPELPPEPASPDGVEPESSDPQALVSAMKAPKAKAVVLCEAIQSSCNFPECRVGATTV